MPSLTREGNEGDTNTMRHTLKSHYGCDLRNMHPCQSFLVYHMANSVAKVSLGGVKQQGQLNPITKGQLRLNATV